MVFLALSLLIFLLSTHFFSVFILSFLHETPSLNISAFCSLIFSPLFFPLYAVFLKILIISNDFNYSPETGDAQESFSLRLFFICYFSIWNITLHHCPNAPLLSKHVNILNYTCYPEKAMAPHSSTLAWKIPWVEEPGRLQSMGSLRVGHDWVTSFTFHSHALEKEMVPHFSILAWRIPGTGEPGGLPSMGSRRVGQDWSDLAAAAYLLPIFLFFTYGGGGLVSKSCPPLATLWIVACQAPLFIFQARILEWVAIFFSRRSSQCRDWTWVFCLSGQFFTDWATREIFSSHMAPLHFPALVKLSSISNFTCEWLKVSLCLTGEFSRIFFLFFLSFFFFFFFFTTQNLDTYLTEGSMSCVIWRMESYLLNLSFYVPIPA